MKILKMWYLNGIVIIIKSTAACKIGYFTYMHLNVANMVYNLQQNLVNHYL